MSEYEVRRSSRQRTARDGAPRRAGEPARGRSVYEAHFAERAPAGDDPAWTPVGEIDPTGRAWFEPGWERRVGGWTPLSEFRPFGRRL